MHTFLEYVAADILNKYGTELSDITVVFPNKRAALFLNEQLLKIAGHPLWSPAYLTISQLFEQQSTLVIADRIKLVSELHKSFTLCTGISETLDHFFGWGELLLSDYDDIDKKMAPADQIFRNITDIHELDTVAYLSDEQKELLRRFFSNFGPDQESKLKERFLQLWSHFSNIYHDFNSRLFAQGLTYEGALYRRVAESDSLSFRERHYLFVGFNLVQPVERRIFLYLKRIGKAHFYWDYDDYYMKEGEAGTFIREELADFPNELDGNIFDNFRQPRVITVAEAASENIQARYVSQWLTDRRLSDNVRTAIVMCDEHMLPAIIHSLPDIGKDGERVKVNITTGYPLNGTVQATFLPELIALQTVGCKAGVYRLHFVENVLRHPYCAKISPEAPNLAAGLLNAHRYFPTRAELSIDEGLSLLFRAVEQDTLSILSWLINIFRFIAQTGAGKDSNDTGDSFDEEALFRVHAILNRFYNLVATGDMNIDVSTLTRLLRQIIQSTSIPFHGEPAEGIQIMGMLETRCLDFDHVLLLSCNEGNLPKNVNDSSFIPYNIRRAYSLTTIDNKVAIYAYYFHRLLQRAGDITICYNNTTDKQNSGEQSRFLLQLAVESPHKIKRIRLRGGHNSSRQRTQEIEKSPSVIDNLFNVFIRNERHLLSPTALGQYLRCPLKFYYRYVGGLKEKDDTDAENIDSRVFGDLFHSAAQHLYGILLQRKESDLITSDDLDDTLRDKEVTNEAVHEAFKEILALKDLSGLQLISRRSLILYLERLLKIDKRLTPFRLIAMEKDVKANFDIHTATGVYTTTVGGRIDRLDLVGNTLRVVDYKTGRDKGKKIKNVEDIFNPKMIDNDSGYYLQAILYSLLVERDDNVSEYRRDAVSPVLLFIQNAGADNYSPTLSLNDEPIKDVRTLKDKFFKCMHTLVDEIFDASHPFERTPYRERCGKCPYLSLCGM